MVVCIVSSSILCLIFMCLGVKYCSLGVYCVLFSIYCGCVCLLCLECYVNHLVMLKVFGFSTCLFFMCCRFVAWQLCCFVICLSSCFQNFTSFMVIFVVMWGMWLSFGSHISNGNVLCVGYYWVSVCVCCAWFPCIWEVYCV